MITISVSGNAEIDRVLKGLPGQLQGSFLSEAHSKAAAPFVQRAKLFAPIGVTRNLERSIGTEKKNDSQGTVFAGVRRGRYKGNHGHLVEYGTVRRTTKDGANRGAMPKNPFSEKAFNQTKDQIERIIGVEVSKKVVTYMKTNLRG